MIIQIRARNLCRKILELVSIRALGQLRRRRGLIGFYIFLHCYGAIEEKSAPEHENVAHGKPAINLKCFDAFSECLAIMERNDVIMIN